MISPRHRRKWRCGLRGDPFTESVLLAFKFAEVRLFNGKLGVHRVLLTNWEEPGFNERILLMNEVAWLPCPLLGGGDIIIDHSQGTKAHVLRVMVVRETERV